MASTVFDKPVGTEIGQLSSLTTSDKTNLVSAINSLNSKVESTVIPTNTLANIESALVTIGDSLSNNGDAKNIRFTVSTASGLFKARDYVGTIRRRGGSRYIVNVWSTETDDITGLYDGTTWSWTSVNNNVESRLLVIDGDVVSSTTSKTITRTSTGGLVLLIFVNSTAEARTALLSARFASNGTPYITDIYKGSSISYTTDTNTITIANSSTTASVVKVMLFGSGTITIS